MKSLTYLVPGVLCLVLVNSTPAPAQVVDKQDKLLPTEKFVANAMECETFEIKMAELAKKNAANQEVKDFAQMLLDSHTKSRKALADDFKGKIAIVTGLDKEHQAEYDRQAKLEGAEFDREYIKGVIKRHEKALDVCKANVKSDEKSISQYCETCTKAIQDHLKQAKALQAKISK